MRATSRKRRSLPMVYDPKRNSVAGLKASARTASSTKCSTCIQHHKWVPLHARPAKQCHIFSATAGCPCPCILPLPQQAPHILHASCRAAEALCAHPPAAARCWPNSARWQKLVMDGTCSCGGKRYCGEQYVVSSTRVALPLTRCRACSRCIPTWYLQEVISRACSWVGYQSCSLLGYLLRVDRQPLDV